jgi:hypothetical protein
MLGVAALVLVSALGPASAARADLPPDPAARLQVVVRKIHVRDSHETSASRELELLVSVCPDRGQGSCPDAQKVEMAHAFAAGSGGDVSLERVVPGAGDVMSSDVSPEAGLPVFAGQRYRFRSSLYDDGASDDDLGSIVAGLDAEHSWNLGTLTARSVHHDGSPGDYDLTYEIRRAPLPDLRIDGVRTIEAKDGQTYCAAIENVGERPSGLVSLAVRADGALVRSLTLSAVGVHQGTEHCVRRSELPAREHRLSFVLDEPRLVPEMDEANNAYAMTVSGRAASGGAPGGVASPEPAGARARPSESI